MIVKNRLLNFDNKFIYQDDDAFLFSLDSVLLANLVSIRLNDKNILDLCSGNAPVPMLMSFRTNANIVGVELQEHIYNLAVDSVKLNNMDSQIKIINDDIKNISNYFNDEYFDVVTCNPPYFKFKNDSLINLNEYKTIARHEKMIDLDNVIKISSKMLKFGGTFALVHRPERFVEIIDIMRKYNIEPKKVRFIYPNSSKDANILFIEGKKNGKSGLKFMPPLFAYDSNNEYDIEIKEMFGDNYVAK